MFSAVSFTISDLSYQRKTLLWGTYSKHRYITEARCVLHERPFWGQHRSDVYGNNYPSFCLARCGHLED